MLADEDILERRVTKDLLVWMVSKVHQVTVEIRANQVQEVYQVNQDQRVPKDLKDHVEKLDHQAPLEKKEKWASQASLAILEEEVQRETEVWLVKGEEMAALAHPVHPVLMVIEESLVLEDQEVNVE